MATQVERRAAARSALLDAALACLVERGVAGFTTVEVTRRSGLSNGALFRYFPTKTDLLAATVQHLIDGLLDKYREAYRALGPDQLTPEDGLRLLWHAMASPALAAVYEVFAVARTDPTLQAAIEPAISASLTQLHELAREVLGRQFDVPDEWITTATNLALLSMQGLVVHLMVAPDPEAADALIADLADLADLAFPTTRNDRRPA